MSKAHYDNLALGLTYQMSLDSFLQDTHHAARFKEADYDEALECLKGMKKCRSWDKKRAIAQESLAICKDCIEAYLALGLYTEDIFETLRIYKEGMELATMNLGKEFFQQKIADFYESEEAKVYFHMKFAYACALFELGYMKKAMIQFQEMILLNPSDVLNVRYYLYALYLYFEEFDKFKHLNDSYPKQDTFTLYSNFLYYFKRQYLAEAKALLPALKEYNSTLFDQISYTSMNTTSMKKNYAPATPEEASYIYSILKKVIQTLDYLHIFLHECS